MPNQRASSRKSRTSTPQSETYLLRMSEETKKRLVAKSDRAGISLAEALRTGGEAYLDSLLNTPTYEHEPEDQTQVLAEFRQVSARVERLFGSDNKEVQ